jgi:polar amino acid transport system permease protein
MGGATRPSDIRSVPERHPVRWLAAVLILVVAVGIANDFATNPRYEWAVVGEWFASPRILAGLANTFVLTLLSMLMGIALGVVMAVMRLSTNPILSGAAWGYVWFFRGTPVFVQIIFWYNLSALYPRIAFGVPFGPELLNVDANTLITPLIAALLALGLNEAAYMSEIVRAGLLAVDHGQTEASLALGVTRFRTLRYIVLPQAMRIIIPPTGNEVISMLKTTSLVSVIAYTELLYAGQLIYAVNFKTIPLLITVSIWYLLVTSVLMLLQSRLERRFGRGTVTPNTGTSRLRRMLAMRPAADTPPSRGAR